MGSRQFERSDSNSNDGSYYGVVAKLNYLTVLLRALLIALYDIKSMESSGKVLPQLKSENTSKYGKTKNEF